MKKYLYLPLCVLAGSCAWFKGGTKNAAGSQKKAPASATAAAPKPPVVPPAKNGVKPLDQVVKNLPVQKGLFNVYSSKELDSVFFEIGDTLLGRDIMVINRVNRGPGGINLYAGEELEENTIYFEKAQNENIRIRFRQVIADADSNEVIAKAVKLSNLDPVAGTFPIKAYGKDSASYVIDMSKFLKDGQSFVQKVAKGVNKNILDIRRDQELMKIKVFPMNVELLSSHNTLLKEDKATGRADQAPATIEMKTSFIALPHVPMQRRIMDPRIGYFANYSYVFGDKQQKSETQQFVVRWRLEPKPEDMARYKSGQLVEPAKPIVFYIDPNTPKQWRKYLILGVNDWAKAFEKAGFKNAIVGKEWPENDTTMDMDDARYSFIRYFPSEIPNAYGPNVNDPRSGEIIQSHIGWYHNVMSLVHDWYMVQAAPNDPEARKMKFSEELMGQLIRFVSSHEVGHTLGLRHNHISSSQTPVESLRDINYLKEHGHTASIMDYARFNYVAQPEDNIPQELLFPRIGEYDNWAIEWGYKYTGKAASEEKKELYDLTTKKLNANSRLLFGSYETGSHDPRSQAEDLGDNPAKANAYGIKNLKRVIEGLPEWTKTDDGFNRDLAQMYNQTANQYFRYVGHVIKFMGGTTLTIRTDNDAKAVVVPVAKEKQVDAMNFLIDEVLTTPTWLLSDKITDRTMGTSGPYANFVEDIQMRVINTLLDAPVIQNVVNNEKRFGNVKTLGTDQYLAMLRNNVWKELKQPSVKIDGYRRAIQKAYVGALSFNLANTASNANPGEPNPYIETDSYSISIAELKSLLPVVKQAIGKTSDALTKAHLVDLELKLAKAANGK
ncbi:zinc-dependent metalloprotease [Pseudoflavitalea rhizosphaerae]|uniref:zinc-dependent metalloprotease n=1 Tax=Pseudoflavitalea rhizosphaerae TaxID=1884793 RepID=UPI000F8D02D1|nr:zinc-dependent metalloprotease [Pseudoflavitalea rhizosphaerae]